MANSVNLREPIASARLMELLSPNPPWNRSLWNIGIVLGLTELHEACLAVTSGALGEPSLKKLCSSLTRQLGKEPTLSKAEKAYIQRQFSPLPLAHSTSHHAIATFASHFKLDYIQRWAEVVRSNSEFSIERFARSVATHLLDDGFSSEYLHAFIKTRTETADPLSLPELCEELNREMTNTPTRDFQVLLLFEKSPRMSAGTPPDWLKPAAVSHWLESHGFSTTGIRPSFGLILTVQARDTYGAAIAGRNQLDRFAARAAIATGEQLRMLSFIWVNGADAPYPLNINTRGVRVKALYRENLIFSPSESNDVDAAIELLSHLDQSSPTAAIAGGWGAIEGLLGDPGNRSAAADNLAALVACSLPRAELTFLSYQAERKYPEIAEALLPFGARNRERSAYLARLIQEDQLPELPRLTDKAAVMRLKSILNSPSSEIATIKETVAEAFHRLYRQRNMILHAGKLDSVALEGSLRTVSKLAGAGMDRVAHGQYVQSIKPLALVARANLSITLINRESALNCVEMLE